MLATVLRLLLGLVFLVYGGAKLPDLHGFVLDVANYQIAPFNMKPWDQVLAYLVVAAELVIGVALVFNRALRAALFGFLALTLSFVVAICSVWVREIDIDCGCGGDLVTFNGYPSHLLFLSLMLTATAYLLVDQFFPSPQQKPN
ncbi:MauE/DoxX family redox-associated membrane protein [Rubritalea marina]|uniref:MauE/DoxX family redox-associated membrane protein n=1 Tax=Rubritalea marina TaxID=361055 RepID=UPI000381B4F2|nr:MauE/DoxX family redox-associated membrane protein [Rubritalea marina]